MNSKQSLWTFDNLGALTLLVTLFILPIFHLPLWGSPLGVSKKLLVFVAVVFAFIFWLLGRLQSGKISLPKDYLFFSVLAVAGASLISSVFSGAFWNSFSGLGFEQDTFISIFSLALILFLFSVYFRGKERFLAAYYTIFASASVLFIFQLIGLFILRTDLVTFLQPLSINFYNNLLSSLIGKWYDFGVYFGFIALSALAVIEFFTLKETPRFRWFMYSVLAISLVALTFINFLPIWLVIGLFSLVIFVYKISFYGEGLSAKNETDKISTRRSNKIFLPSFIVVLIALLFITVGSSNRLGSSVSLLRNKIAIPVVEVKPSWTGTFEIAQKSLMQNPVFGVGPNNFSQEWTKYRSDNIVRTSYWNVDFRFGVGLLPTYLVTTGILGVLAWLVFLFCLLLYGFRFLFKNNTDKNNQPFLVLSFLGSVYLWTFTIIYTPNNTLWTLTFIVTGLFVAMLLDSKIISSFELSLNKDPRINFVSVLTFVVLIIGSITIGYLTIQKYVSYFSYQRGIYVANATGDLNKAQTLIVRSINLSDQDAYRRTMAELNIAQIKSILGRKDISEVELRGQFLSLLDLASTNANRSVELNKNNYLNWLLRGNIYSSVVQFGIGGAYEEAKRSFAKAQELSPNNPAIYLDYLARLEINNNDLNSARDYAEKSLSIKNDYLSAVSFLSQLDSVGGDTRSAIDRLENYLTVYPGQVDENFLFQLGMLKYQNGDYAGAITILERILAVNPIFANARYILGQSYLGLGRKSEALEQFKLVQKTNPGNSELETVINNLMNGGNVVKPVVETETSTSTPSKSSETDN